MVALMVGLLIMTGCDDPTNVGQGLLDSQAGETRVITLQPNSVTAGDRSDPTGGNAASGAVMSLMGVVDDPVRGVCPRRALSTLCRQISSELTS